MDPLAAQDLARQADYFGLPFAAPVAFPINTSNVQRLLNALDVHTGGSGQSPQLWSASLGTPHDWSRTRTKAATAD